MPDRPVYDGLTFVTPLLAIRDAWTRKMEAGNVPNGDDELAKLNKAIKKRLNPNSQTPFNDSTASSKLMSIERRFVRHRDKRAFNFSKSDSKYLASVRKVLKRRRRGVPLPRAGAKPKNRDRLLASLNESRPALSKDTSMDELEVVRQELIHKKKKYPTHFGEDEREYLKRVISMMGSKRRVATMEDVRKREEKLRSTTGKRT